MSPADPHPLDAAAGWVARTRDPLFGDWDGFTRWLEADPSHNDAYEAALDAHDAAGALAAEPLAGVAADVHQPRRSRVPRWAGGAIAAALVGAIGIATLAPRPAATVIETAAGEQRAVRLGDGSVVALNGSTRIAFDAGQPRLIRLERGEATFSVRHDAERPFAVESGPTTVEDLGTVFNVVRTATATDVAVAEGKVLYDPRGAGVELGAGRTLHDPDAGAIEIGDADPASVGGWRRGRLSYRNAAFATIAADLSRATGATIAVDPAIATRTYTGTIALDARDPALIDDRIAPLLGLRAQRTGKGWRLSAK